MSTPDTFGLQLVKYISAAALAILVYDYFVTLHSEVQWAWGRKWGVVRITFIVSRYVPFAGAFMTLYSALKTWGTQDVSTCSIFAVTITLYIAHINAVYAI